MDTKELAVLIAFVKMRDVEESRMISLAMMQGLHMDQ